MKRFRLVLLGGVMASLLSGCGGEPEWMAVYEECKAQVSSQTAEMQKNTQQPTGENQAMQSMMNSMNNMAMNMAASVCEAIRTTCEQDPDGATCQAYIEQSRKQ